MRRSLESGKQSVRPCDQFMRCEISGPVWTVKQYFELQHAVQLRSLSTTWTLPPNRPYGSWRYEVPSCVLSSRRSELIRSLKVGQNRECETQEQALSIRQSVFLSRAGSESQSNLSTTATCLSATTASNSILRIRNKKEKRKLYRLSPLARGRTLTKVFTKSRTESDSAE